MKKLTRPIAASVLALAVVIALAACGSSNSSSTATSSTAAASSGTTSTSSSSTSSNSGVATVVAGTFPQSLDPSIDFTTQGGEVHWLTYLGPYSFAHASGTAGTQIIPSVATTMPTVSNGGKTYTFTIRKGLTYSDGSPVKASDLTFAIERDLKLGWSAASFLTSTIQGAVRVLEGQGQDDLRHHDQRRHRPDHDPSGLAVRRVPRRARGTGRQLPARDHADEA